MTKLTIQNRRNQKIIVLLEQAQDSKGLVIIAHGLGGNKDELQIVTVAEVFKEKHYTVVCFDATNTFGESDGTYEDATVTSYKEDLENVITWVKKQSWYREPFVLVGHSLGGITTTLYAEEHPKEVKALAPISAVISGNLSTKTPKYISTRANWEKEGWIAEKSSTVPSRIKRLPWSHMVDRLKYDVLPNTNKLTMPVLCIVGDMDDTTPPEHQKLFYEKLQGRKEMHIIKDASHTFKTPEHLNEIKQIFCKWIDVI